MYRVRILVHTYSWKIVHTHMDPSVYNIFFQPTWAFRVFIILFIQYYSMICRPSDHTVERPWADIRTRDRRSRGRDTNPLDHLITFTTFFSSIFPGYHKLLKIRSRRGRKGWRHAQHVTTWLHIEQMAQFSQLNAQNWCLRPDPSRWAVKQYGGDIYTRTQIIFGLSYFRVDPQTWLSVLMKQGEVFTFSALKKSLLVFLVIPYRRSVYSYFEKMFLRKTIQ